MARSTRLRYGATRHQRGVLVEPAVRRFDLTVVLVHGGFWRWPYNRYLMTFVALDLRRRGWDTATIGYRRLGRFGGGGGWPGSFDDVHDAIVEVRRHRPGPIVVVGHSAGGHLGLVAAHRLAVANAPPDGVVAIGAPTDIRAMVESGSKPAAAITSEIVDDRRWATTSPVEMVPLGVRAHIVHGMNDATIDPASARRFVEVARGAGDDITFELIDGDHHRDVLSPRSSSWLAVVQVLECWSRPV